MKIGIDLDGVVIDSETTFRTYKRIKVPKGGTKWRESTIRGILKN